MSYLVFSTVPVNTKHLKLRDRDSGTQNTKVSRAKNTCIKSLQLTGNKLGFEEMMTNESKGQLRQSNIVFFVLSFLVILFISLALV